MSDSIIQPHNEITGLIPVNHHQRDESRKFQKRKKGDKDNPHPDIPEEAVEDMLHHEEEPDETAVQASELAPADTDNARDHLDMLL